MSKDSISSFCSTLASFCNHLQFSCDALKESLDRRPIPLDSASSTFVQCLNRRISSASSDLELLDSMSFGTVSFEELLGHCNELYKKNQSDLFELEESLRGYGYIPIPDIDDEDEIHDISRSNELSDSKDGLHNLSSISGNLSVEDSRFKSLGEDALNPLDESLNLKKLGLSDACLATLACEANESSKEVEMLSVTIGQELKSVSSEGRKCLSHEAKTENIESAEVPCLELKIMKSEFESLPGYMKGLASWEDILAAVDKINSSLNKKAEGCNFFRQDEIPSFNLVPMFFHANLSVRRQISPSVRDQTPDVSSVRDGHGIEADAFHANLSSEKANLAFLLVKQKFTPFSINAIVLHAIGAGVLVLHSSGDRPEGVSTKQYVGVCDDAGHGGLVQFFDAVVGALVQQEQAASDPLAGHPGKLGMSFNTTQLRTVGMLYHGI